MFCCLTVLNLTSFEQWQIFALAKSCLGYILLDFLLINFPGICTMFCSFFFSLNKFFWKSNISFFFSCVHDYWGSQQSESIYFENFEKHQFWKLFCFSVLEHTLEKFMVSCCSQPTIIIKCDVSHFELIIIMFLSVFCSNMIQNIECHWFYIYHCHFFI